ncbi:hypothetical protein V8E54_000924 [Elaphomyces granulatus]
MYLKGLVHFEDVWCGFVKAFASNCMGKTSTRNFEPLTTSTVYNNYIKRFPDIGSIIDHFLKMSDPMDTEIHGPSRLQSHLAIQQDSWAVNAEREAAGDSGVVEGYEMEHRRLLDRVGVRFKFKYADWWFPRYCKSRLAVREDRKRIISHPLPLYTLHLIQPRLHITHIFKLQQPNPVTMWQRAVKFLLSREVGVSAFGGLIPTVILGVIRLKSDAKFKEGLDGVKSDLSNFRKEVKSDLSNLRKEVTGTGSDQPSYFCYATLFQEIEPRFLVVVLLERSGVCCTSNGGVHRARQVQQESFRRTLLLLLDGAFSRDESALSEALQALY